MHIAVDISMLEVPGSGISRYIKCLLPLMIKQSDNRHHWLLYGRTPPSASYADLPNVTCRSDYFPNNIGRISSLFSSQTIWGNIDKPDVYWSPAHRLPWLLPKQTASAVTIHDLCWLKEPKTMRRITYYLDRFFMPRSLASATEIIAISQSTAEDIKLYFNASVGKKVSVATEGGAHMPAPLPLARLKSFGIEMPYVLFVGSFEPRKNLARLLQAFQRTISQTGVEIKLVMVGAASWGQHSVQNDVAVLGITDKVIVLDKVDDQILSTLYRHAQCLAAPSLLEGFCLPVVEAMSFGTPVLASISSAFPEVVGQGGVFVDPLDVDSIASGLSRLLTDEDLRRELGEHALRHSSNFSWEQAGLATLNILEHAYETKSRTV
jgi:glycosyltransferase involved in cell wall biosynthesis